MGSHSSLVELGLLPGAVALERARVADGVAALKDPVLPCAQAGKDLRLHRLRTAEAQVGLQTGQRVGREARALLQEDAHLVVPVDIVERECHQSKLLRRLGIEELAATRAQ